MTINRPNFASERFLGAPARRHVGCGGRCFAKGFRRFAKGLRIPPAVRLKVYELLLRFKPMRFDPTIPTTTGWPDEKMKELPA